MTPKEMVLSAQELLANHCTAMRKVTNTLLHPVPGLDITDLSKAIRAVEKEVIILDRDNIAQISGTKFRDLEHGDVFNTMEARWAKIEDDTALCVASAIRAIGCRQEFTGEEDVIVLYSPTLLRHGS